MNGEKRDVRMSSRLLSVERAAMMLGITQRSVLNLIERRRLVAYRIEGVWRVDIESVRRYLAERELAADDPQ